MPAIELDRSNPSRVYLRGNTFAIKDKIKAAGGHWDADQRAWWLGLAKLAIAEQLAGAASAEPAAEKPADQPLADDAKILGKATYKGRAGYLLLWEGETKRGPAAKLAMRDGSKTFWASLGDYQIDKLYRDRDYRGGRHEPGMTFGRLKRLQADFRQAKLKGIEPCGKCGGIHSEADLGCYFCGCPRCPGAHGDLCDDD